MVAPCYRHGAEKYAFFSGKEYRDQERESSGPGLHKQVVALKVMQLFELYYFTSSFCSRSWFCSHLKQITHSWGLMLDS